MPGNPEVGSWKFGGVNLSLESSSAGSPLRMHSNFDESPSLRRKGDRYPPAPSVPFATCSSWSGPTGRENARSNSLTKLQLEKWNLQDQIKTLEAQVRSRDLLIQENQKLRDALDETANERDSIKQKYVELAKKLALFVKKEKNEKKHADEAILKTKRDCDNVELERERILEEKNHLSEEVIAMSTEIQRLRDLTSRSVDRDWFERQKQDLLQENSQLRLMIEDSIPKCLYQRLEQQLTESVATASLHGASLRELQLDNQRLLSRLNKLEHNDAESTAGIQTIQKQLHETQHQLQLARDAYANIKIGHDSEVVAIKTECEEALVQLRQDLARGKERYEQAERRILPESKLPIDKEHIVSVSKNVKGLRSSLASIRTEIVDQKISITKKVEQNMEKVMVIHDREMKRIAQHIYGVLAECGVLDRDSSPRAGVSESLETLRTVLVRIKRDLKSSIEDYENLAHEVGNVKKSLSEKDTIIDGLVIRLANAEKAKKMERSALASLKASIKSAEDKLNSSRLHC